MIKKIFASLVLLLAPLGLLRAQELRQQLQGLVIDQETQRPLVGAAIRLESNNAKEAFLLVTDSLGTFREQVPIGRYWMYTSMLGYQSGTEELLLTTGRQANPLIVLKPLAYQLAAANILAASPSQSVGNKFVYAGAIRFNPDEVSRYAGSLGDPARMVRSYAGVSPVNDERNDIVIRGNTPIGVSWRVDGIEISNPNHYGGIGLTGNRVTLLNMNLLAKSDFYMGAWTADQGNALSGVFDVQLRDGSQSKREAWIQLGWNGLELGTEGRLCSTSSTSYILSYRYSFLDIMEKMGLGGGAVIPEYQDATIKLSTQVAKHRLSFLSLWGDSHLEDSDTYRGYRRGTDLVTGARQWINGFSDEWSVAKNTRLLSGISYTQNNLKTDVLYYDTQGVYSDWHEASTERRATIYSSLTHSLERTTLQVGFRTDYFNATYRAKADDLQVNDHTGDYMLTRVFGQGRFKINNRLSFTTGVHAMQLSLNGSFALEPRVGMQYYLGSRHVIGVGAGIYHQTQPSPLYFVRTEVNQEVLLTNKGLDFSQSKQLDFSYSLKLNEYWRMGLAMYHQRLSQLPVKNDSTSIYSIVNTGADYFFERRDSLVSRGLGKNTGVELTVGHFFRRSYYALLAFTLYRSQYSTGLNPRWFNTAFSGSYIVNFSSGYEWNLSSFMALMFDLKSTFAGGQRYMPVLEEESKKLGRVIYDKARAYEDQYAPYFRIDVKLGYRLNFPKWTMDFAMDLQNITNHSNLYRRSFDPVAGSWKSTYQQGFMPMFTTRIQF